MKLDLDEYAHLNSPIHRWDIRCKLIGLTALIFAFACVEDLALIPVMLGVTIALYCLAQLPPSFWYSRLRYPGLFLLGIVGVLPFFSGETILWQWGMMTVRQEGCLAVLLIAARFLSIMTVSLVLFSTAPFLHTVKAMRSLGLPDILTDMLLLSYRYLYDVAGNLSQMQRAMRLRGFSQASRCRCLFLPHRRELQILASLTGTLLIRSYEQSERVYKAMRLRGYGATSLTPASALVPSLPPWHHAIALGGTLIIAVGLVIPAWI